VTSMPTSSGTATRKAANSVDVVIADSSCPSSLVKKSETTPHPYRFQRIYSPVSHQREETGVRCP
jgi:hypothetical protein